VRSYFQVGEIIKSACFRKMWNEIKKFKIQDMKIKANKMNNKQMKYGIDNNEIQRNNGK